MKQFLLLVQLRSHQPEPVRAALLAALVAWALQEEEGQALLRQLSSTPTAGQENLVEAYLPLLEQWEAAEIAEKPRLSPRPTVSVWGVLACCTTRLSHGGAGAVEPRTRAVVFAPLEAVFLPQSQATLAPPLGVSGVGSTASPGNSPPGGFFVT